LQFFGGIFSSTFLELKVDFEITPRQVAGSMTVHHHHHLLQEQEKTSQHALLP
jgi:hypothetical protein